MVMNRADALRGDRWLEGQREAAYECWLQACRDFRGVQ